jgi:hypothetical protein
MFLYVKITVIATERNFEDISDKLNLMGICASGNCVTTQRGITKL